MKNIDRYKTIEIYKKMRSDLGTNKFIPNYDTNKEKFNIEVKTFIDYIKSLLMTKEKHLLYIHRKENVIQYGQLRDGLKKDKNYISMLNDDDLILVYFNLRKQFSDFFSESPVLISEYGVRLEINIGNTVFIKVESDSKLDRSWIGSEFYSKEKNHVM